MTTSGRLQFSVSSKLLRELGERLVGKAHAALAELIKNGYDADAEDVEIIVDTSSGIVVVEDNGHGMSLDDFEQRFMRIGTTHKSAQQVSPRYGRRLTGSKGIGRLAAQFIGTTLTIETSRSGNPPLRADIDWANAHIEGELTDIASTWSLLDKTPGTFAGKAHGTRLTISGLRESWTPEMLEAVATAVRSLRSPFAISTRTVEGGRDPGMSVRLLSDQEEVTSRFDKTVGAILDIWIARLEATWRDGKAEYRLYWRDIEQPVVLEQEFDNNWSSTLGADSQINHRLKLLVAEMSRFDASMLRRAHFEVRFYKLKERQPQGVPVADAREYFEEWGGVHVFDAGFRLPYYGDKGNDWLKIAHDQTQRRTRSILLPQEVAAQGTIEFLPDMNRIFGVVSVDTNAENLDRPEQNGLILAVTRDRLVESPAFLCLWVFVRFGIDWFAIQEARRVWDERSRQPQLPTEKLIEQAIKVLESAANSGRSLEPSTQRSIQLTLAQAKKGSQAATLRLHSDRALLAALATAGMSAIAYRHELNKLLIAIRDDARSLQSAEVGLSAEVAREIGGRLLGQCQAISGLESLFSFVSDEESRKELAEYSLSDVVRQTIVPIRQLAPHVVVTIDQSTSDVFLPRGTLAEWTALFRNIVTNAFQAVMSMPTQQVRISGQSDGATGAVWFDDSGCGLGVPISQAEQLFAPFERRLEATQYVRERGLGGTGMGLTIVRMISENLGVTARFLPPPTGWATRMEVSWKA